MYQSQITTVEVSLALDDLITKDSRLSHSCGMKPSFSGHTGPRHPGAVPADDTAALLGLASMRSWMAPEGTVGVGQDIQAAGESIAAQPPAPREPPPHRGLTFGTRTALSSRLLGSPRSHLEDNAVLDRKVRPRWRRRRRQHDGRRADREETPPAHRPGKEGGGEGAPSAHLSLAPTHESSRSRSLSSSSLRSARRPSSRHRHRRRHHRRRRRPHLKPRSPRRSPRRRPPPRPEHRPPP